MEELWLIIAVTVGLFAVIAIALSTRKKRTFRDGGFTIVAGTLVVLGIIFGSTDQLLGYSLIGLSVLVSIITAVKGLKQK
jgi:lipopolysaccharide export LptBFGC system permease protein LptF